MNFLFLGFMLQKIVNDAFTKLNETDTNDNKAKMHLLSGHELNVAFMLILLNVFNEPHIPPYGAQIIFELHEIDGTYGYKVSESKYIFRIRNLIRTSTI